MSDEAKKRFPNRKHEEPVAGSAKSRTQARVVTQAEPSKVTAPFKTSTKKHKPTSGGDGV